MIVWWRIFGGCEIGQLFYKLVWLMDQDRQTLRADKQFLLLKLQSDERSFHVGGTAVETD